MSPMARHVCIPERREDSTAATTAASIRTKFSSAIKTSKYSSWAWVAHRGRSLLYTIALFVVCRQKISQLNAEIAKLKVLSPTGELQLTSPFHSLTTSDGVSLDAAAMQDKIKELANRISEVYE